MLDSHITIKTRKFNDIIEWQEGHSEKDILHIYSNDEVDLTALSRIIELGQWDKLQSVYGFFAGIYETRDRVFLFCDRLGIYPLFYYKRQRCVYISPSVPDLLNAARHEPSPCMEGVISLLLFGHHLADETVIEGIKRCKGGTTVKIGLTENGEDRIVWKGKHIYQDAPSIKEKEMGDLFVREVERCIYKERQIVITFSGGFDSRAVLGAALECVGSNRIHTLTFGDKDSYDRRIAEFVARKAGVKNTIFPLEDQVFSDDFLRERSGEYGYGYSAFATQPKEMLSHISKISRQGCSLFWGVGGDAISGSHLRADDISLNECENFEDIAHLIIRKRCFLPLRLICEITSLNESEIISTVANLLERSSLKPQDKSWHLLDTWDIFTRGRMELIAVLPFRSRSWRCPHLGQEYFSQMSTECFEGKLGQNTYKSMLSSRFRFLFSFPTRRLKGKSLTGGQWQNLYWNLYWRAGRISQSLSKITGQAVDSVGRNYGRNNSFLRSAQGREKLQNSINILLQQGILEKNTDDIFRISQGNTQAALILISLGYAFGK